MAKTPTWKTAMLFTISRHRKDGVREYGVSEVQRSWKLPESYTRVWEFELHNPVEPYEFEMLELIKKGEVVLRVDT